MQILTLAGNVGKDAELRRLQNGDPVLSFSLACDNGKDKGGEKRDATWYDCSIWGKRAESLERYITKGCKLTLTGRPTVRVYEGKPYLGISVNELAFQGGGQERQAETGGHSVSAYQTGRIAPAGDIDDEIPF